MRIIDINTMIGSMPEKLRYLDAGSLVAQMDSYRITSCVAYSSTAIWSPARGNSEVMEAAKACHGRIRPCLVIDPALEANNIKGEGTLAKKLCMERPSAIKLFPKKSEYILDEFYCGTLLETLNELRMPVLLDEDQISSYQRIPQLARIFPDIKFVLLRQGFRMSRYIMPILEKLENVYFDTSIMIDTGIIEEIVRRFGSGRLVFGSGMPRYVPAGGLSLILYSDVNENDRENILSLNWERMEGGIRYGNQG